MLAVTLTGGGGYALIIESCLAQQTVFHDVQKQFFVEKFQIILRMLSGRATILSSGLSIAHGYDLITLIIALGDPILMRRFGNSIGGDRWVLIQTLKRCTLSRYMRNWTLHYLVHFVLYHFKPIPIFSALRLPWNVAMPQRLIPKYPILLDYIKILLIVQIGIVALISCRI